MSDITEAMRRLEHHQLGRRQVRRFLLRKIRENKHLFENDTWLKRKIEYRYLGDLSDNDVLRYSKVLESHES